MNIDHNTELRRLALILHREPEALSYLAALDGAALMRLRTSLQNSFIGRFSETFKKLAAGGKIAPDALSAFLCKKVFGPALTANMSYYTPIAKSVAMCKHLDADFMADIARSQVPERAEKMLAELPVELMRKVTRKLLESSDYPIMGGFTDFLPEAKGVELMQEITDPADQLRISRYTQRKDRIARLACMLRDDQLKAQLKAALSNPEFVDEVVLVTSEMPDDQQRRMAKLADAVRADARAIVRAAAERAQRLPKMQAYFS